MYTVISTRNKNISVLLRENRIAVVSDEQLLALVTEMPEAATDELVSAIKKEYYAQFNKVFDVTDASMAIEIWGHVFAEKFTDTVKAITRIKLVDELAEKISSHCEVINIGRKGNDNNRFVWDRLASFKSIIAAMLLSKK
jgi:hypothetical protein